MYYWREASLIKGLKVNKTKLHKGFFTTAEHPSGILTELYPYSKYKMYMVVANREFEGPQSNAVEFETKEGGMSHYFAQRLIKISREKICECMLNVM